VVQQVHTFEKPQNPFLEKDAGLFVHGIVRVARVDAAHAFYLTFRIDF